MGERPAIEAYYVVPEFFRELYRVAQERSPELANRVRLATVKAMNGSSILIDNGQGQKDIVFLRRSLGKLNLLARHKLEVRIQNLAGLRKQVLELRGLSDDISTEKRTQLQKLYAAELEGLQEYERTASTFRLYKPYFLLSLLQNLFLKSSNSSINKCVDAINITGQ